MAFGLPWKPRQALGRRRMASDLFPKPRDQYPSYTTPNSIILCVSLASLSVPKIGVAAIRRPATSSSVAAASGTTRAAPRWKQLYSRWGEFLRGDCDHELLAFPARARTRSASGTGGERPPQRSQGGRGVDRLNLHQQLPHLGDTLVGSTVGRSGMLYGIHDHGPMSLASGVRRSSIMVNQVLTPVLEDRHFPCRVEVSRTDQRHAERGR